MSTAEDIALPGLDSVHEVQNYLSVQLLSRTGTHILRDIAGNLQVLPRTALGIQSFAVRELSSHGPWVMTKCQAAWKLQALLTVTLWRTKLLPSRECSPSAATPSGSHPPEDLWCHKCHMKSFVQRASAHLKCPHLRNLPCQHPHARIPGRKNTCSHLAVNPTCRCKQTIPSLTQKVIKDWHTTAMTKKAHSACLYHSTSTSRRRLTKEHRKTAKKTTSRPDINTQSLPDQKHLRCGLISFILRSFTCKCLCRLRFNRKYQIHPDS